MPGKVPKRIPNNSGFSGGMPGRSSSTSGVPKLEFLEQCLVEFLKKKNTGTSVKDSLDEF